MPTRFPTAFAVALALTAASATTTSADTVEPFLTTTCLDCHDGPGSEGNFDLTSLSRDLSDPATLAQWVTLFDRVDRNEMPPADADQPSAAARTAFTKALASQLTKADQDRQSIAGRTVLRRLNRNEYERTLTSIFGIPQPISSILPADATAHGFENIGEAMRISYVQMDSYLEAIDVALDRATVHRDKPPRQKWDLSYRNTAWMVNRGRRQPVRFLEDGVEIFGREGFSWLSTALEQWVVPVQGRYKIRFNGYALRSDTPVPVTMRAGGAGFHGSFTSATTTLGFYDMPPNKPATIEWEGWLEAGRYIHIYPSTLPMVRYGKNKTNLNVEYDGPSVVIQSIEVDGPIGDQWPPESHRVLYDDLPLVAIDDAEPPADPNQALTKPPTGKTKSAAVLEDPNSIGPYAGPIYKTARYKGPVVTHRVHSRTPKKDATRLIRRFATQAFRRPVSDAEAKKFARLVYQWLDDGSDFEDAMRVGFKAVLTSPQFLFFEETTGPLDGHALASRLSYFLTGCPPDTTLRMLAKSGKLTSPDILRQQTDRLLATEQSRRTFVTSFVDQWLDLKNIDFTSPDIALYPEFDELLRHSMLEETYLFIDDMLAADRPVQRLVDSRDTFINGRLADVYNIPNVHGTKLVKVNLPDDSVRGGIMTQASVLKVTANGTTTSPVVRGVWVLDRILGQPSPPPPPGVPAVEPDIRGLSTIRDQLAKHREIGTCARCHKHIDPPGFALEAFDPIGNERDKYRVLKPDSVGKRVLAGTLGPKLYMDGPAIDASYDLADGTHFDSVQQFKALLLRDPEMIARTVASKLTTYATGAGISFADRAAVDDIVDQTAANDYGLRSIVHAIVQSDLFRNK